MNTFTPTSDFLKKCKVLNRNTGLETSMLEGGISRYDSGISVAVSNYSKRR